MISQRRRLSITIVILLAIACLAITQAGDAMSEPTPSVAGIFIDYGNDTQTYALLPLDEPEATGLDLLEASGLELLTLGSGGWGVAVCSIEQVGCDLNACRMRLCQTGDPSSPYWQYLQAPEEPHGGWVFSNRGASSTTPKAGTVDAWFWLGTRPTTASVTLDDIADRLEVDLSSVGDQPVVRTFGPLSTENATSTPSIPMMLASGGVVVMTATVGIVAIRRSRAGVP